MRNSFSQLFLHAQVALTGNHNTLCLRRACTVHGFCTVADSCRAKAEVFDETQYFQAVFRRYGAYAAEIFFNVRPDLRIAKVFFRRSRYHEAAGNIFGKADDFIGKTGDVLLAYVRQQEVDEIVARSGLRTQCGAGDTG